MLSLIISIRKIQIGNVFSKLILYVNGLECTRYIWLGKMYKTIVKLIRKPRGNLVSTEINVAKISLKLQNTRNQDIARQIEAQRSLW